MANSTRLSGRTGIQITLDSAQLDAAKLAETLDKLNINVGVDWTWGVGENMANLLYHASLSATDSQAAVDISGTDIQDAYGDNCDFAALKLIYIKNTHETLSLNLGSIANHIDIFGTILDDYLIIPPGGFFLWCDPSAAGLDVTTNCKIEIQAATSGTVTYDIVLLGEKTVA